MRLLTVSIFVVCFSTTTGAHHPDREHKPVHPRIDVIGPLGNCLPASHRRRYNRPTKIGGMIAYYVAPSSQEAMAWHSAKHRCLYKNHRPRIETHYFYPKPWEAMRIGARPRTTVEGASEDQMTIEYPVELDQKLGELEQEIGDLTLPIPVDEPIASESDLIEQ